MTIEPTLQNAENGDQSYSMQLRRGRLVFKTRFFRAETGSMLHSGIYNRELTSSLASGAMVVALVVTLIFRGVEVVLWHYVAFSVLFFVLFFLLRVFIFYEEYLEAVIDKPGGLVSVSRKSLRRMRFSVPLSDVTGVRGGYKVLVPENPDGIQVVEKVALQHGTVIPGFGEVKEFHTVHITFKGERDVMLFSSPEKEEAQYVLETLKRHIGGNVAKED